MRPDMGANMGADMGTSMGADLGADMRANTIIKDHHKWMTYVLLAHKHNSIKGINIYILFLVRQIIIIRTV